VLKDWPTTSKTEPDERWVAVLAWTILGKSGTASGKQRFQKKVKIFGWRVARDNLATKLNKKRRNLEIDGICNICGREDEDSHHAIVRCTKSLALRHAMRDH
jgi:hypothetical protein